jgi:hypothetical protein
VELAAPGEAVMAAPLAAGAAALVRSLDVAMTPTDVVRRLQHTSAVQCGTRLRRIDAAAAVDNITPPSSSSSCR